jgi:hypothetical protein
MQELNKEPILHQVKGFNVSDRYQVIPSIEVIQEFQQFGFEIDSVQAAGVRSMEKALHQRHMVRLKQTEKMFNGEIQPQVVMYNSYDGTKALEIHIGFYRFVCSNGIIAGTNDVQPLKIMHSTQNWRDIVYEYIDGYSAKIEHQKEVFTKMKDTRMSLDEAYILTEELLTQRHYDDRIENTTVDPLELLVAKRKEDRGESVWHRFNIVQESLVNGLYHKYDNAGGIRKAKVLTNIDEIVRVNKVISNTFERRVA